MLKKMLRPVFLFLVVPLPMVILGCLWGSGNTLYGHEMGSNYNLYFGRNRGVHSCGVADDNVYIRTFTWGYDDGYTQAYGGDDDPQQFSATYNRCITEYNAGTVYKSEKTTGSGTETCPCKMWGENLDGYGDGYLAGSLDAPEDGEYPRSYKLRWGRTPKGKGLDGLMNSGSSEYDPDYTQGYSDGYEQAYNGENVEATIDDMEYEINRIQLQVAWMAVNQPGTDTSYLREQVNTLTMEVNGLSDGAADGSLDMPVTDSNDYNSVEVKVPQNLGLTITVSESLDTMDNTAKTVRILLNGRVIAEGLATQSFIGNFSKGDVLTLQVKKPGKVAGRVRNTVTSDVPDLWWGN